MRTLILLAALSLSFCVSRAQDHVPNEAIVQLDKLEVEEYVQLVQQISPGLEVNLIEQLSSTGVYLLGFQSQLSEGEVLQILREPSECIAAQWNHTNIELRVAPDDPSYIVQWNLTDLMSEKAWDITTGGKLKNGEDVVVAVIDNSFQITHDDLVDNLWKNTAEIPWDSIDNDNNGFVDDYDGWNFYEDTGYVYPNFLGGNVNHGTRVLGMIGARTNNTTDIASVNWNVKLLPIIGSSSIESTVIKAYDYVLEMKKRYLNSGGTDGANILVTNSSFGVNRGKPQDYPIWCAYYDSLGDYGIISVGAGPNSQWDVDVEGDIPSTCPSEYLVAVTRTNRTGELSGGGYGALHMDLGAPGVNVISTSSDNSVNTGTGTSYSAPMVAGALALMYSAIPADSLTAYSSREEALAKKVRKLLLDKGTDPETTLDGKSTTGGRLNLYRCVLAAIDSTDVSIGVEDYSFYDGQVTVFPNPARDVISVQLKMNDPQPWKVEIMTLQGQIMQKTEYVTLTTHNLNIQNLSKGIYVLRITSGGQSLYTGRLLKQ